MTAAPLNSTLRATLLDAIAETRAELISRLRDRLDAATSDATSALLDLDGERDVSALADILVALGNASDALGRLEDRS